MLKQKVNDFLIPLNFRSFERILMDSLIEETIKEKEKTSFGFVSEEEETLLAQEIALKIAVDYVFNLKANSEQTVKIGLEKESIREYMNEKIHYPTPLSITDESWDKWVNFFLNLFDIHFVDDNFFKTKFEIRLLNGLIVECYSPFYYEHINLYKQESGEPLERVRYTFYFHLSRSPESYEYIEKYSLTRESAEFIKHSMTSRFNIILASPNENYTEEISQLLFNFIPLDERVIRIEKKNKINTNLFHQVHLPVTGEIPARDLIKASLRMRPERIFIDSLDSDTVFDFSQACNTGHDGSFASFESESVEELKRSLMNGLKNRYDIPETSLYSLISESLDCIVFINEHAEQPSLSFYRFDYDKSTQDLQTLALFSEDLKILLKENLSEEMVYKMERHTQKPIDKPIEKAKKQILPIDIDQFFNEFNKKYKFDKIYKLKSLLKPTISIHREKADEKHIPIGSSKFGGNPDLPKDLEYPFDGNIPYSFIMQINCEEVAPHDKEGVFPSEGMLYFFHKFEDEMIPLSFDFEGEEGYKEFMKAASIFHYDGVLSTLTRVDKPKSIHMEKVKSAQIQFASSFTLPHLYEEESVYLNLGFTEEEIEEKIEPFYDLLPQLALKSMDEVLNNDSYYREEPLHQLFGYDTPAQASPLEELADDLNGRFKQSNVSKDEWMLLCQLEVDVDINLCWAGDGFMYYYIKKEDLIHKNFNSIYSIMQCG